MDPGSLVTGLGVMPRAGGGDEVETFHVVGELHVCFDELAAGVDAVVRMLLGLHRPGESAPDARLYVPAEGVRERECEKSRERGC